MALSNPKPSEANSSTKQFDGARFWHKLVEPSATVSESLHNQARLLSGLLLAMISICLLSFISQVILSLSGRPLPVPILLVTLGTTGALALAYHSNKVGRYTAAAALTIIIINVGTWGVIVATPATLQSNTLLLPFLVLPLLVCGALMTVSFTVAVVLFNVAFVALIHLVLPGRTLESFVLTLFFVGTVSALIIVNVIVRNRDHAEIDRQTKSLARSNAELHTNAAKLKTLFEVLPVGISILNTQQQIVEMNLALQHILKMSNEGLATGAYNGRKYIHPNGTSIQPEEFASVQATETHKPVLDIEMGVITETGETIWTSVSAAPLSINDLAAVIVTTDITGRKQAEAKFRGALDSAPDAIVIVNQNGTIAVANAQTEELFGYQRETLLGQSIELLIPESLRDRHIRHRAGYVADPHTRAMGIGLELNCLRKDGTLLPVEISLSPLETEQGTLVMASIRDITERKLAEQVLNELNEKLANNVVEVEQRSREIALLNEMGTLLQTCLNSEEAYRLVARFSSQLFPNTGSALCMINPSRNIVEVLGDLGKSSTLSLLSAFQPQDCWALRRGQQYEFHAGEFNQPCYHFPGAPPQAYLCVPLMAQGEMLGLFHLQMTEPLLTTEKFFTSAQLRLAQTLADNVSLALANLLLRDKLSQQSIRDPLTNLFNRRYLVESLEHELRRAARGKYSVGVIMLDLDHFKRFNDTFGHNAGDAILREVGGFLAMHVRGGDIVCRYGGEEFTLILPETSLADTQQRAERLRESVKNLQIQDRDQLLGTITFSCGVAAFPDHGATPETVLQAADAALYRAKKEGRDRVSVSE